MGSRILPAAADALRAAITEAHGNEVFAIGDVDGKSVAEVTITCRGQADRVTALIDRPRPGQVVIHNHPSGNLTPSDADLNLAGLYGEKGVGVVIVDNQVTDANWVLEPHRPKRVEVPLGRLRSVFESDLPRAIDGYEVRDAQLQMADAVNSALDGGTSLAVEAGTGTGKSLAYLVPAALWALANESKVVVSTYTRTLQSQLMESDVPSLKRAGLDVRVALLQGRNNYLCRRRLELARSTADEAEARTLLESLDGWSETTEDGSRLDLPFDVPPPLWESIQSDSDTTLRARCPHFATCHYYNATRKAAAAHIVIVNHALMIADRVLQTDVGRGVLPRYDRLILDEAHHLEDAATNATSRRFTVESIRRAVRSLLDRPRRVGALTRLTRQFAGQGSRLAADVAARLADDLVQVASRCDALVGSAEHAMSEARQLLPDARSPLRIVADVTGTEDWSAWIEPRIRGLADEIEEVTDQMDDILEPLLDLTIAEAEVEPMMELRRARGRLLGHIDILRSFLAPPEQTARWIDPIAARRRRPASAAIAWAPIEVDAELKRVLWNPLPGTVATSATLTVGGKFSHWASRVGLFERDELLLPSPFDHFNQALLGLPRDLAEPNTDAYVADVGRATLDAVRTSGGGAFVLCTSYAAVDQMARVLREGGVHPVLAQGATNRTQLLRRFLQDPRAVLVGTDSFWEGVSVKGDQLRLVVLPRIPFRVPTDPLQAARQEAIEAAGRDPFTQLTLPAAVLKLRQGYGRLIRSTTDRGVVLLLDTRIHSRRYGRVILSSLPPARRVKGPWSWVSAELQRFYDPNRQNNGS